MHWGNRNKARIQKAQWYSGNAFEHKSELQKSRRAEKPSRALFLEVQKNKMHHDTAVTEILSQPLAS